MILEGNLNAAKQLPNPDDLGVATPSNETLENLRKQFPKGKTTSTLPEANLCEASPMGHTDVPRIKAAISKLNGTGGPSHLDSKFLKKLLLSNFFNNEAVQIITSLAAITNHFATSLTNHNEPEPLRAVRLIALNKPDGSHRSICVGEIYKRLLTKLLAAEAKKFIKSAVGALQCNGLHGACEAAHAALDEEFNSGKCALILDAKSAFNLLNERWRSKRHIKSSLKSTLPT